MQISQIWEVIFVKGWKKHYITFLLGNQGKYYIHWQFLCSFFKGVHL